MPKGLMVAIGIPRGGGGKPDIGSPGGLDEPMPKRGAVAPQQQEAGGESKVGPEDVDYSANDLCGECANMADDGNCTKYGFPVEHSGHCEAGFQPKAGEEQGEGASDSMAEEAGEGEDSMMGGSAGYDHGQ